VQHTAQISKVNVLVFLRRLDKHPQLSFVRSDVNTNELESHFLALDFLVTGIEDLSGCAGVRIKWL
jgi:hypothetical protein